MAMDPVAMEVWASRIPVIFTLAPHDLSSLTPPKPHYAMVPRVSYLPLALFPALPRFQENIPAVYGTKDMWFEHKGVPLRWHVPFGVLFDQLSMDALELPWSVTVHFQGFPSSQILRCPSDETVKWQFYNSLKQATFLRRGSVDAMMGLSKEVQTQLWLGLSSLNQDMYTIAARALLPSSVGGALTGEDACVAVRVVRPGLPFLQRPVTAVNPAGALKTVEDVLVELLGVPTAIAPTLPVPELAVPSTASAESGPPSDAEASESVGLAHVDIELSSPDVAVVGRGPLPPLPRSPTATSLITLSKFDVSVHGVPLPLAAPIRDVWAVMAHPDNFLYILLTPKRLT